MPSAEMARRLEGVSERSVRYRISRLKKAGVVRVTAILNPQSLGYAITGDVMIDVVPGRLQDVAARLTKIDQVSYVAGTVGDGDLNVQIHARDAEELVHLVETAIGTIQGVTRVRTTVIPWKLKEICDWRMPAEFAGEKGAPMT